MSVESFYNPPPRFNQKQSAEKYLEAVFDWIGNTEVHGNSDKQYRRVDKSDIPGYLKLGEELGLSVWDVGEAVKTVDGVATHVARELMDMKARRDRRERARQYSRLPKLK